MCQLRRGRTSMDLSSYCYILYLLLLTLFFTMIPRSDNRETVLFSLVFGLIFFFLIFCGPNFHNLTLYEYVRAFSLIDRCESAFYFIFLALTLHPFRGITVLNWIFLCLTLFVQVSSWPYLLGSVFLLLFTALLFTEILKSDNSLFSLIFRS